jgi:hypothetical protein
MSKLGDRGIPLRWVTYEDNDGKIIRLAVHESLGDNIVLAGELYTLKREQPSDSMFNQILEKE